jgi:hypothetical protein
MNPLPLTDASRLAAIPAGIASCLSSTYIRSGGRR